MSMNSIGSKLYLYLQMSQLPSTCAKQDDYLSYAIPHSSRVCGFTKVAIVGFTFSLILLFPADVLELLVKIPEFAGELWDMWTVLLDVRSCWTNNDVEVESNVSVAEPGRVVGWETNGMITRLMRGECKDAVAWSSCLDDNMTRRLFLKTIVSKLYRDSRQDSPGPQHLFPALDFQHIFVVVVTIPKHGICLCSDNQISKKLVWGNKHAFNDSICWELLNKTAFLIGIKVEVESVCCNCNGQDNKQTHPDREMYKWKLIPVSHAA